MEYLILTLSLSLLLCLGCGEENRANQEKELKTGTINVATAANVQFAMEELEMAYEAAYNADIRVIIGSSGKLTAQIEQGAPYDLLISANLKYPERLYLDGYAVAPPKTYALGRLVLWTMDTSIQLDEQLTILTKPNIQKISIANPKNAPYGEQALNVFKYYGLSETLRSKLVYGESIAQANQYIITKNCEVGITAKSVVVSSEMRGKGKWIDIPMNAYQPIKQGIVITKYGMENHEAAAKSFYKFLFSLKAKQILEKHGYAVPVLE